MSYPTYSDLELEIQDLEKENKTLKDKIEFLTSCLDDRDKSIAIMQEENKKLKKKTEKLEKELELVYKAYHTAMWVDYNNEEDLYTIEDIEWHNAE